MKPENKIAAAFLLTCLAASSASAGWTIEQRDYTLTKKGDPVVDQKSTMLVSKGRVRVANDPMTMIIDYKKDELALLLQEKHLCWKGSVDAYLREIAEAVRRRRFTPPDATPGPEEKGAEVKVKVQKMAASETVGTYTATRYEVTADGKLFQEIWVANDLDLGDDLDPKRVRAFQVKMSGGIRGDTAASVAAVNRDPEYLKLFEEGFPVRTQSFLGNSTLGHEVVSVARKEFAQEEFSLPPGCRHTDLGSLLDAQDALAR